MRSVNRWADASRLAGERSLTSSCMSDRIAEISNVTASVHKSLHSCIMQQEEAYTFRLRMKHRSCLTAYIYIYIYICQAVLLKRLQKAGSPGRGLPIQIVGRSQTQQYYTYRPASGTPGFFKYTAPFTNLCCVTPTWYQDIYERLDLISKAAG